MTMYLTEPTKTLVDLKLYTVCARNIIRSEIYNELYHGGPKPIEQVFFQINQRIANNMVNRPIVHGDYAKIELVQALERAEYRSSFGSSAEWKPDHIDWNVSSDTWLFDKITERCNDALNLVLHWACSTMQQELLDLADRYNVAHTRGTAQAVLHLEPDSFGTRIAASDSRQNADGTAYVWHNALNWCFFSKEYSLWIVNPMRRPKAKEVVSGT